MDPLGVPNVLNTAVKVLCCGRGGMRQPHKLQMVLSANQCLEIFPSDRDAGKLPVACAAQRELQVGCCEYGECGP